MRSIACLLLLTFSFSLAAFCQSDSLFITMSDSVRVFVKRAGKGVPVLFVHGGPGSNSLYFEKEGGNVFEKDVQMIYMDQRGCGRSDTAHNNDYSLDRLVLDMEEVKKALGYQQWILMPHSFGGIIATQYAYRYPEAVKAMVMLNCTINIRRSAESGIRHTIKILNLTEQEKNYLLNDSVPLLERWGNAFWHLRNQDMSYAVTFDKKENYKLDSALINQPFLKYHFGRKVWNFPEYFEDFSDKTATVRMPVLVISGTRDYTIGPDHPKYMKFPNMKLKKIEGVHALYLENNADLYKAVRPFLKKYS